MAPASLRASPSPQCRLTSAGPAEQPLSTERAPAGRSALLRPWGRESWEEWEGSPEGCEGASPSRLGRGKPGARWDAGSRVDAAPPVRRLAVSAHSEIGFPNRSQKPSSSAFSPGPTAQGRGGHWTDKGQVVLFSTVIETWGQVVRASTNRQGQAVFLSTDRQGSVGTA